jgi:DNA-binding CsgD family transcriptional regulator
VPADGLVAVVVAGEAGIGKSRLLAEAARVLAGQGCRVIAVRADRLERQVPYGALGTALRAVTPDNSFADGLRREALAVLDLSGVPETDAFGRACATMTRLLTALTAASPLALVVDDLHELDDDSIALLSVVLRRLASAPIALVAAVRAHLPTPNAAADELLEHLADNAEVVRLDLGTLSRVELGEMIAPLVGGAPDDDLAAEVHGRADGNPFFATEIARSLAEARLVAVDGGHAHLSVDPGAVRLTRGNTVLRRVVPLAPDARAVARTLAVLRTVRLERLGLLAEVSGLAPAAVAVAFDQLVRAHVVTHDPERGYRFSHDIVAEALYDEIGPAESRRLHGLVAKRLLAEHGTVDLLELAWHLSESASTGDATAVAVLTDAARHALSRAPEAAAAFCARALALLPPSAERSPERAGLLALRCRALARASRPAAAASAGREALALLPAGEDRVRTATAMIGSLFGLGRAAEALAVADEEVQADHAPAALHAQRALLLLLYADRTSEALKEAALASGGVPASPAEEVVVCTQLAFLSALRFRLDEAVEFADRAFLASGTSTTLRLQALAMGAWNEALAGLVPQAARRLRLAEQLAEEADARHAFPGELGLTTVALHWFGGRWDTALELQRSVLAELESRQQSLLIPALTAIELEMRTWRGEFVLAERLASRPAPAIRRTGSLNAWALAGFLAARGDVAGARRTLRTAVDDPVTPTYICLLLGRLAELEFEEGRVDEAGRATDALAEVAMTGASPWWQSTLHRVTGLVHRDADELVKAVREAEAGGLVFERARAQLALGSEVADLVEAHQTFARLGAHGLRREAARRLHERGAKVPRARSRAAGLLTESEERVARLVQQGMRNREIAAALHYSPRSIEVYLSRIYAKLRVSSRLELARKLDALDS